MQINSEKYLILCGNWENSFQVISLSDGRIVQSIRQHKDVVGCVAGRDILLSLCYLFSFEVFRFFWSFFFEQQAGVPPFHIEKEGTTVHGWHVFKRGTCQNHLKEKDQKPLYSGSARIVGL
jgi:hypothetical protein